MSVLSEITNIFKLKPICLNWKTNLSLCVNSLSSKTCKKDFSHPMQQTPTISEVENGWYEWWEKNKFFKRTDSDDNFVMILPPPNVTGKLHMGHALTCALQDAVVRWNQMNGRKVFWIPGCDHAGIGTQVVVEQHLLRTKGLSRHDLGRERFVNEVKKWKSESEATIYTQMKRLGVALDWDRAYFTLDTHVSEAVTEAFTRLFEKNLIYRGSYMINWCSTLQSVISDLEVEMLDLSGPTRLMVPGHEKPVSFGQLYDIKYQLVDSDVSLTVSTTRPETVLGDTALMVHPHDPHYFHVIGKKALHPFRGDHIPVIADQSVERDFGTGVVKVTPGHSFQDYEVSRRHNLPVVEILDDRGWITGSDVIQSQPRFAARGPVLDYLASKGLLVGSKPHALQLPRCRRTGDIIEPRLKIQWFLNTKAMAEAALEAVENNHLRLHPPTFSKVWCQFLANNRDWCISRQLWWGHRVPVYWASTHPASIFGRKEEIEEKTSVFVAAATEESAAQEAARILGVDRSTIRHVEQEEDVLDTWFSSALLPFVILGWPKETAELEHLFPLSLMETGHDILFFWVARMVMMSLQLTDKLPFHDVLLHGLIRDEKGKMSKSKGNALDPLDIINGRPEEEDGGKAGMKASGADALRFYLCSRVFKDSTITINTEDIDNTNSFRNKMWQSLRFLLANLQNIPDSAKYMESVENNRLDSLLDKWLMSHMAQMVCDANEGFTTYNIHTAARGIHTFWYLRLCDVYMEMCKPRLWNHVEAMQETGQCLRALWTAFHTSILTLAPFMPFLSEEMYARLPCAAPKMESVMQCSFPRPEEWNAYSAPDLEQEVETSLAAVHVLRGMRKAYNIVSKRPQGKAAIYVTDENVRKTSEQMLDGLQRYSFLAELRISDQSIDMADIEPGFARQSVRPGVVIEMDLQGLIVPEIETIRLGKLIAKLQKKKENVQTRLTRAQKNQQEPQDHLLLRAAELKKEIELLSVLQNAVDKMK